MTTSGTISYNQNRNQIIRRAFRQIGAFAQGETPDATSVQEASDALNALVKHWETSGLHIWTETEGTMWCQPSQYQYSFGAAPNGTYATLTANYQQTTLLADAALGATSISVSSTTGFAAGVYVGVMLSNSQIQWTTQSGAVSGATITLAAPLTQAASAGALVWTFPAGTLIQRPLRIVSARRVQWNSQLANQIETPMNPMLARLDYRSLPNKATTGTPTQAFYDAQLGTGQFYLWPAPQDSTSGVNFTFYRTIEDFDTAVNTPDFPQEWIRPLVWNLAVEMAPEYDCPAQRFAIIQSLAAQTLEEVRGWDKEIESSYFGVSMDQRSGN